MPHSSRSPIGQLCLLFCLGLLLTAIPTRLVSQTEASTKSGPLRTEFINGALAEHPEWKDTQGELINAHDGGILYAEGKYHWYGMALRSGPVTHDEAGSQKTTVGVVMYGSKDLLNWENEGVVLPCRNQSGDPLCGPMRFERPKILRNPKTGRYVMWFHYVARPGDHGNGPGQGDAGVAESEHIAGPYHFIGYSRPLGEQGIVRDSGVFQDENGSAYFLFDRDVRAPAEKAERVLHIVRLTDDYLGFTQQYARIDAASRREAPVLIKRDGHYYLITSGMTGWKFNQSNYYTADSVLGPYRLQGDPFEGAGHETTFEAQGTQAFPLQDDPTRILLILERHNTTDMLRSSYLFLPLNFSADGHLHIPYLERWNLKR